ncbi:hypothetical protein F1713_11895 [Streptococcus pneumoniae]|nr:hypothetical protein F1713_11895 [Streptococcus pneumoniae]
MDPIFQIGKAGINDNMISQIDETLENRELIKIHGLDMFVYQGAESFKIWTGKDAEIKEMKLAVLNQLKGE